MKSKRVNKARKRRTAKAQPRRASAIGSAYTMRLAALKGNIWDDLEEIDISEHLGLCDAFAAGAAKCLGLTKRTGWPTRIIFVCRPNDRTERQPPAALTTAQNDMSKSKATNRKNGAAVRSSEIVGLPASWRKTSKWYRGRGFKWNDNASVQWRKAKAQTYEDCAKELSNALKKARQSNEPRSPTAADGNGGAERNNEKIQND